MINQETDQSQKTGPRFFYGYIVVIALVIIQALMFGPRSSFGVFFKPLIAEFGWTRALISGVHSISTVIQGFAGIIMGGLNDRLGPRVVLTICGLFVGLGFMLMSLTGAAWQLYLYYALFTGIGMGGLYPPQMSTVARWFVKRRSVMTGIVLAGGGIGGLIVPPVINLLISVYGWRMSCVILGAVILVIIVSAAQCLKRDPAKMGLVPYGENKGGEQEVNLGTEGYSFMEATHTRQFWTVAAMFFCFGFCIFIYMVHIVPHVTDLGISAATAANILASVGGAILVSGIVIGGIADRIGNRQAFIICFILISAALFFLLTAREVWMLYLTAAVLGFGSGGGATLESPLVAELFGIRSHGLIMGVQSFSITIGAASGPFIAGYIFDSTGSYQAAFTVCAAVSVVGLILAVILRPVKKLDIKI